MYVIPVMPLIAYDSRQEKAFMTMDDYRKLKEEIESSGMSIRQYCLKHNLSTSAVYNAFSKMKE